MAKSKSLDDKSNEVLRRAIRAIVDLHSRPPKGAQGRAAAAIGVSGSFLSEFLSGTRGAGPELLRGVARYRPLEVLQALEINPKTVLALWSDSGEEEAGVLDGAEIPDALRRAARAAIELLHCTADEARKAAESAYAETAHHEDADADWWLLQLRERLPRRKASGVRRKRA